MGPMGLKQADGAAGERTETIDKVKRYDNRSELSSMIMNTRCTARRDMYT